MLIGAPGAASPPWPLGGDGTPTPTISHESLALRQGVQEFVRTEVLPLADRLYLTEVDAEPEGDAFFPEVDTSLWKETGAERYEAGEGNDFGFTIRQLDRVGAFTSP